MGFFQEFDIWLTAILSDYIAQNTAAIARALEPAIVTLGVLYVMVWGYLQLVGKIQESFLDGVRRLLTLALILAVSLQFWLHADVIVATVFDSPRELAAIVVGAGDAVSVIDQIFFNADDAASLLLTKAGIFSGDIAYYFAAFVVYVIVGLTAVYTMFLFALSKIALSVLIAAGPIFTGMLFFESTKRFFEAWVAQLSNYVFLIIFAVLLAALMMHVITVAAEDAVNAGEGIEIAHALRVCLAALLTFLIMKQVPAMAQAVASGIALSTFGAIGAALRAGMGLSRGFGRGASNFSRGAFIDQDRSRWDSVSRKAGQRLIGLRMPRERRPRMNSLKYERAV